MTVKWDRGGVKVVTVGPTVIQRWSCGGVRVKHKIGPPLIPAVRRGISNLGFSFREIWR